MFPSLIRAVLTVGPTWQVNEANLPDGTRILLAWSKRLKAAKIERRRKERRKNRTFSMLRDQCSITACNYRDTHEESWQSKNRKEGTPGADN